MNLSKIILVASTMGLACFMATVAASAASSEDESLKKEAKISLDEAKKNALNKIGGGTIFDHELEKEEGKLIYSFDISQKNLIKEVHVDAKTGAVLSVDTETVKSKKREEEEEPSKAKAQTQLGKAADNKIYAQTLVREIMSQNPDLLVLGLHAVAPGAKHETMIATNLDRIGKQDDADDIAVATERKTILAPNLKEANKFEVQIPLMDASGKIIGATGLVFKYKAGDDEVKLHVKSVAIRDALAKKIPNLAALFKATK